MTTTTRQPTLLRAATADITPAYFALVMATGIISIAAYMFGLPRVAYLLFYLNTIAYVSLWLLHGLRLLWFPQRWLADMFDYGRGPGYFTWVASTAVLGSQFIVLEKAYYAAWALLALAGALWLGLTYAIFTGFAVRRDKPPLHEAINGGWLLAVVATQAVAVLSAHIAAEWPSPHRAELNFLALCLWLWGGMLYIWLITLIFYRYVFFDFSPGELTPPFWISMGAMAISTLAGSLLVANSAQASYLASLQPFIKGITILYWVTGSWWIPMLLLLGVWRHVIERFPLEYDPLYWGAVFPLGMYTVATEHIVRVMDLGFLQLITEVFLYASLLAWGVAFAGLLRSTSRQAWLYLRDT